MTESDKQAMYWTTGTLVVCIAAVGGYFWLV